ncbi:recombinase RecT, partial [bacterium]|nr:recombinase RecT [bacterium]
ALFQSAQLGLEPNVEGQAYINPYLNSKKITDENGKTKWIKVLEAQFQIGYKGYIELFYRHEAAEHIDMHAVHEHDRFEYQYGSDSYLHHTPVLKDRGEVIAYYAVAKIKGGGSVFKVMGKDACIEHGKTHSKCFDKETQSFDKNSSWFKYPDAMCKKTVLIQLAKLLPKSVELQKALSMDNTTKSRLDIDMFNIKDETNWDEEEVIEVTQQPQIERKSENE